MYNLAYNLADVPAIQIGEQIGDVLLPSFARMEAARRPEAFVRALSLLGLVVFPLAVGLGVVAPTLVATLFDARWAGMGMMLALLSALSVARPVGWAVASYLQAQQLPRNIFKLEAFKLLLLLVSLGTFGRRDPRLACVAVGVAFAGHALASLWVIRQIDGIPVRRSLGSLAPALAACLVMAAAVLLVQRTLTNWQLFRPGVRLFIEIAVGGMSYVAAASLLARSVTQELLSKLRVALKPHAAS
jgi:PST family polysaccharide transporter